MHMSDPALSGSAGSGPGASRHDAQRELLATRPMYDVAGGPEKFIVDHALGARVFSGDRSYIDLCMGYGALLLGHGAATVKDALQRQLEAGWMYGFAHARVDELAALIRAAGPANEQIALCNSESDATLLALRAARAHTGRERIAVFAGAHHGLHDFALITDVPAAMTGGAAASDGGRKAHVGAGILAAMDQFVIVLPYGDDAALGWVRAYSGQLAAVIVEPVASHAPGLEHGAWLQQLQNACRAGGTCFVLDEAVTGFRLCYGGAQELFGLEPDLVTYGNVMGGGLPIGAIAGRAEIMAAFGADAREDRIFSGSAHAGNPLSVAAAVAVLDVLNIHRDTVYPQLNDAAAKLAVRFNDDASRLGASAHLAYAGSVLRVMFTDDGRDARSGAVENAFYRGLFERRIVAHASKRCFLSTAHTVGDITELSTALADSLAAAIS